MFPLTLDSFRSRAAVRGGRSGQLARFWALRRRRVLGAAAGLLSLGALAGLGGLYEYRHVSAGVREPLMAAVAPGTTAAEFAPLLRRAARHLHTRRDRLEFHRLQRMAAASTSAALLQTQLLRRMRERQAQLDHEVHSEELMLVAEQAFLRSHQAVPPSFSEDVTREQLQREEVREENRRADENAWLLLLQERLEARLLAQQLRVDLGLAAPVAQP